MATTSTQPVQHTWKAFSTDTVALIKANNWGELVNAGKFEELKAVMSLEATKQGFLNQPTHRSIVDVFEKPTATLATVKKYRGEARMQAVVEHLLKSTVKFLNVGRGMNEWQIAETARMIAADYYYLTVADLKVCFRNGLSGKYGQVFDRIDGMVVLTWLNTYDGERAQFAEMESTKHMKAKAESEKATHMPEWLSKWLSDFDKSRKKVFEANSDEAKGTKFFNLQSFLQFIGRDTQEDKTELWQLWENQYLLSMPEIEFEPFMVYQSNRALIEVNKAQISNWDELVNFVTSNNQFA